MSSDRPSAASPAERQRAPDLFQIATTAPAVVASVDWFFEPCWKGERLLVRYERGELSLTDRDAAEARGRFPEAVEVLHAAIDAEQCLIDGIWTAQPFVGAGSAAAHLAEAIAAQGLQDALPDPRETERARAFVAIDLVELDGEPLHDIPYQERRRLLASVVAEGPQVRISPAVKLPIGHWLHAWRQSGFTHYVAKHVNSRYRPGEIADDWIRLENEPERPPTIFGRLFGERPKKVRRISDTRPG